MKTTCPHCQELVDNKKIKVIHKNGIYLDKECPSCNNWFRLKSPLAFLKTAGISLLLITSLLNIFNVKSEFSLLFSSIGFVGIFVSVLVIFFGQYEKFNKPNSK